MVRSFLEDGIVYVIVEGALSADEMIKDTDKWFDRLDEFSGYLVDITSLTKHSALEQRRVEAEAKRHGTPKPRAIVGNDDAAARLIKIYTRFTRAEKIKYFSTRDEAKKWILGQAA